MRFGGFLLLFVVALCAHAQTRDRTLTIQPAGKPPELRHALVIGNSNYTVSPLKNPVNDARAMAKALGAAGFNVRVIEDATHVGMQRAVRQWGDDIAKGGVGLFYYAGHGLQVKGRNYLVPVNADIDREDEIDFSTLDVNFVLAKMESAKNALNIVILDACRNNPFARSFRSASRGLAQMDAPTGTFIAFATAPGSVASDGAGANGLYTEHLLREMAKPGMQIEQMFKQVRINVMKDTKDQQIPWESSSMRGDFAFKEGAAPVSAVASEALVATAVSEALKRERDALQREREAQQKAMEGMIAAALEKQRAMLEAQGLKMQAQQAPPKPAGPDPREKELKAAAENAAAERAAADKAAAEAKALAQKAAEERLAAQKAVAALAAAEKAAADRTAAAKLAVERAEAERIAAQKAAAEMNATADRATAERTAAEKERAERVQLASAAPVSIASSSGGRLPQQGDTWTYRLTEPKRREGPKQREYVATVAASSGGVILERYSVQQGPSGEWVHGRGPYLTSLGVPVLSPYLMAFDDLSPGASLPRVQILETACNGRKIICAVDGKVIGRETITVPAGRFETTKVKVEHLWQPTGASTGGAGRGGLEITIWYSEATKRAVKFSSRVIVGYPPVESDFDLELVSYQLK